MKALQKFCYNYCTSRNWSRDWSQGGCYLHLEVSEFIEALRGKGGEPTAEAGDVLFVLLTILEHYGLSFDEAVETLKKRVAFEG